MGVEIGFLQQSIHTHDFFALSQAQTMEMMYRIIAQELKAMNIKNAHPQDYLNFYCLGNREESSSSNGSPESNDKSAAVIFSIFIVFFKITLSQLHC